jgi:DNA topoisomerase I
LLQVFEDVATVLEAKLFPAREDGLDRRACPSCKDGRLYLNGSPGGAFVACSNYRQKGDKQCKYIRNFDSGEEVQSDAAWEVGMHPEHNAMIYIKNGRYGRCFLAALRFRFCSTGM